MSWFNNISGNLGNLSQIASNVTNFTKEVLQDAATESFDDIHTESEYEQNSLHADGNVTSDELVRKVSYLQNELQNLSNDISYKDEQILFLQDENLSCRQYENHIENLKAILLEKDKEIETFEQRSHQSDSTLQEQINKLNIKNTDLEAKLSQQQGNQSNDSTDSWTDDWSMANNSQDINDLAFKNECLSNDLAMKEVVIQTIENKMSSISNNEIVASNFNEWIDVILHEKVVSEDKFKQISNILEEKLNLENHWKELCGILAKHTGILSADSNPQSFVSFIDQWLVTNTKINCTNLDSEIDKYKNIILNIENSIAKYSDGYDDFKISDFKDWLDNLGNENFIYYNDDSKNMLEKIQDEIRENDDEDADFHIENFSIWLEKQQCKIDDLEVDIINEQETRDAEEQQRILERETLNELFNQKQNEISLLKVELYHKQSAVQSLNPIMEVDQEELMTIHEQLNEANTRCEALQQELAMVQKQSLETGDLQQRYNQLSAYFDLVKEQFDASEEKHRQTVSELTENCEHLKRTEMASKDFQTQIDNLSAMNDCIKEQLLTSESSKDAMQSELNDYRVKYESISTEFEHVSGELKQSTNRYELLQAAETVSDSLQLQLNDLSADKDQLKEQLQISETSKDTVLAELVELKEAHNITCAALDECTEVNFKNKSNIDQLKHDIAENLGNREHLKEQLDILSYNKEELIRTRDEVSLELEEYKVNYKKVCDELNQLVETNKHLNESNKSGLCAENELQDIKTEFNLLKLVQLQSEEDKNKLQCDFEALQQANNELSVFNQQFNNEFAGIDTDLNSMCVILDNVLNNCMQANDLDTPLASERTSSLFGIIQVLAEKYFSLQNNSTEFNHVSEQLKIELQEKELKIEEQTNVYNILVYIVKSINELLPEDKRENIITDDKLSSTDISHYESHINTLVEFIRDIENTKYECVESCNETKLQFDDTKRLLELERSSKVDLLSQIDHLNVYIASNKNTIEQLQSQEGNSGNSEDLEKALEMERATNEQHRNNINELNNNLSDYKKTVDRLRTEAAKSAPVSNDGGGGGKGGMKFGALKKKMLDLESQNVTLLKEVEGLRLGHGISGGAAPGSFENTETKQLRSLLNDKQQECECYEQECKMLKASIREMQEESSDSQALREKLVEYESKLHTVSNASDEATVISRQHQEHLHSLSLMLTEKNEEIEQYQDENEHLKSKLLEVENETSDLELIREECKQLKAMLVGKEHQNKVDDTITTLQSESKQLKQLLTAKDSEVQYMQNIVLEKENELSNMELIREECKQLKQMLIENGQNSGTSLNDSAELEAKNAEIIELRNSTSDMDLLREECKQLKHMLLNNTKVANDASNDDSSNVSSQLLEAMLEDRDVQLAQQSAVIEELQNKTSSIALIQQECQQLKTMLAGKQQADLLYSPSANTTGECFENSFALQVQQLEEFIKEKEEDIRIKNQEIQLLTAKLLEKENSVADFDLIQNESKMLKDMLKEKEELFIELQNDFDSANDVLQQKNEEFKTKEADYEHRLQESQNLINAKDMEIVRLTDEVTESFAMDENLHILQTEYRDVEEHLKLTQNELYGVKQLLEKTDNELTEVKCSLTETENECERLRLYADQHTQLNITLEEKNNEVSNVKNKVEDLQTERESLLKNLQNNEKIVNENKGIMKAQEDEIVKLQTSVDDHMKNVKDKNNKIVQLESELSRSKEHQENLLESIKMYSSKEQESKVCKNCEYFDNERQMINGIIENIRKMLQISTQIQIEGRSDSIIEQLSFIESSLPILFEKIREKDIEISNLNNSKNELKLGYEQSLTEKSIEIDMLKKMLEESNSLLHSQKDSYDIQMQDSKNELNTNYDQIINEKLVEINNLKVRLEENSTKFNSQKESYGLKIQDLQSQLVETSDIQVLYNNKCSEFLELQKQFLQEQKKCKDLTSSNQIASNSRIDEELECLRNELQRNSHLYLNKNKECDTLKLEVLQLEETIHNLNMNLQQLKGYEETAKAIPTLQLTISNKDEQINELKSSIEDNEQKLESSRKQKQILDELLKTKGQLDKEREELLFQNEQKDRLIQEKEVSIKHKDVTIREMDSKTKRELERLRGHMIMTEEAHTKDIIELQDKEEALQQELDEAKQGLSKKSIILQDSSKQFQEHCIDLEEQLHSISAQRDAGVLELSKCHDRMQGDATAIYNLQNALEQLEKEKTEQSEYLLSMTKRKEMEQESRIEELTEELNKTQSAMSEASLAVQGINKLNLELKQKENELKVCKEKMGELVGHLHRLEEERKKILEAADHKLDKSLLRNLFMKYFQAPNDKRSDILHVIGGLLGWNPQEIAQLGSGAAPSKVGGWINSVWSYGASPNKTAVGKTRSKPSTPVYDANKSLSELFVKFLEDETAKDVPVDTTSLTLSSDVSPNLQMFVSPTTPDILAFHNNSAPDSRIPAPGQEIPRVHTHHAQSTLKSILTSGPY